MDDFVQSTIGWRWLTTAGWAETVWS